MSVVKARCKRIPGRGRCTNPATGDDGLCGICRNRSARQRASDEKWAEQRRRWVVQFRQAAFVQAWRAEHPRGAWGTIWTCPLCGKAIQTTVESAQYHQHDVEAHQHMHGQSWLDYLALAGETEGT